MLSTKPPVILETKPFTYGYFDDVLLDKTLLDYFPPDTASVKMPGKGHLGEETYHNKWHLNKGHHNFRPQLGPWIEFYRWIAGGEFRSWLFQMFDIRSDKGRMEFSWLPAPGGYLLPHTDSAAKVFSGIIYHPLSDVKAPLQCGPTADGPWAEVPWKPNRMAFFLKNQHSWHQVPVITQDGGYRRTVTVFILKSKVKAKKAERLATGRKKVKKVNMKRNPDFEDA